MRSYTYNMEVKDIDGKGYDAYKISGIYEYDQELL